MAIRRLFNRELRYQEGATSWVLGTAKLKHRTSTMWPITRGRDVSKEITKEYSDSQLEIGWTEEKCIEMDKLAQEGHSNRLSREEFLRYPKHWYLTLSGKNAPMRLRSDFRAAGHKQKRLHRESGEERAEPIPFQKYQRWAPFFLNGFLVELGHVQKLVELMRIIHFFELVCSRFRLQLIAIYCNRWKV